MKRTSLLLAAIALVCWTLLILVVYRREIRLEEDRIQGLALSQARALHRQIVDLRAWNTSHGGVYVAVTPTTPPNPYLAVPHRDVMTSSGKRLTLLNPAYMTRQLGEIARQRHGIQLHLTSLKPLRPANEPDPWERTALEAFERGTREQSAFAVDERGATVFRYMAQLPVEEPCLECHRAQGYRVGQIRGGLSISYPAAELAASRSAVREKVLLATVVLWALGCGLMVAAAAAWRQKTVLLWRMRELALEDELTGLSNRRGFLLLAEKQLQIAERTGHPGVLVYMDLDTMKEINDQGGHPAGDEALRQTAAALRTAFRGSDILARQGGDEFVAFCPNTGGDAADAIVASIEKRLADANAAGAAPWRLSLSIGIAVFDPARPVTLARLINEADGRMYEQKLRKKNPAAPTPG